MFNVLGTGDKLEIHLDGQGAVVELQSSNQLGHGRALGHLTRLAVDDDRHAVYPPAAITGALNWLNAWGTSCPCTGMLAEWLLVSHGKR